MLGAANVIIVSNAPNGAENFFRTLSFRTLHPFETASGGFEGPPPEW